MNDLTSAEKTVDDYKAALAARKVAGQSAVSWVQCYARVCAPPRATAARFSVSN